MVLLERITRAVSPAGEGLALAEQLAYEVPRQVANVHMIVNVTTVLLLLPFTNLLAKLIVRVVDEGKPQEEVTDVAPELNTVLLDMPPLAIDAARRELLRLGERVGDLLDAAVPAILDGRDAEIDALRADEDLIALAEAVRHEFRRALQAVGEENRALATSVIDAKSQLRELERTVIDASLDNALGLMRPSARERELAEPLRRGYSLIRRFVRVGTGLDRGGIEGAAARNSLMS